MLYLFFHVFFFSIFCFINKVSTDYTNLRSPKVGNKLVCGIGPRKTIYHSFTYLLVQQDLLIVSFFKTQTDTVVNKTSHVRVCLFLGQTTTKSLVNLGGTKMGQ